LVTVILAIIGLLRSNYRLLVAAAVLAFPFSWYISGFPIIQTPAFFLPLLLFFAGFAMNRKHEMIGWFLAIIYFLVILLLLFAALAGG
jgi:hypothetical protein